MMSTDEASRRLGVKRDTLYAYVSRGVLTAHRQAGSRRSAFDAGEIEALARRGRPRRTSRPAALDLVVETGLTRIADHRLLYRGRDACHMAETCPFEEAAEWLWGGTGAAAAGDWRPHHLDLQDLVNARDRIRACVVAASAREPSRSDLTTAAVTGAARRLVATMVASLPDDGRSGGCPRLVLTGRPPVRGSIAGRLWARLTPTRPGPAMLAALNAALVLLADHELASSTLAARVAASVRADPFSVVLAGLGPLAGPLHGGASALTHAMIVDGMERGADAAAADALARHRHLPGFGHPLYPGGDPRARVLLRMLTDAGRESRHSRAVRDLTEAGRLHTGSEPNVDFALAALTTAARMPAGAGETIFTIARTTGWIAHAIEEYTEAPVRFRARAVPTPQPGRDVDPGRSGKGVTDGK